MYIREIILESNNKDLARQAAKSYVFGQYANPELIPGIEKEIKKVYKELIRNEYADDRVLRHIIKHLDVPPRMIQFINLDEDLRKQDSSVLDKVKGWFTDDINEAYKLRLENDEDLLVLHIRNTRTGERAEVRGKPNYEIDYDADDELHQLLDVIGKASNISELMNGKIVNINPKHPDGPKSYAALDDLMKEGAEITIWTNPEYQGSDVDDEYYNKQPAKIIDISKLTPFEPADKMDDPISATNMGKLVTAIQAGKKIKPIVVVPHEGKLLIVDGHHRYFAHIKAGVDKIRAVMADPKDLTWRDDVPVEEQESIRESYEIEFVCVNPNFCDATEQKNQDRLFQALRAVPGIIVYKQDFDEHNSMAAIIKDEADTDAPKLIQKIAQQHKVAIDLENDVSQSMMDDIITGRLEGLTDYYDTDNLSEDLRAWFGKGKKGGAGGGGWDRYNSKGERVGKCGDGKGKGKPKCLSKSAAAKLRNADKNKDGKKDGKAGIAKAVKRKQRKDPNTNRKGKAKNVKN